MSTREVPSAGMLVEAVLLTTSDPMTEGEIAARLPFPADVRAELAALAADYEGRGIEIAAVAGGWCVRTRPEHSDLCREHLPRPFRLNRAAQETLTAVAYYQPVTRSDIERVRGVSLAKGTLDMLLWAGLVRPGPRRSTPGNPMTFLTTDRFLRQYDLASLADLPGIEAMREAGLLEATGGAVPPAYPDES